MERLGLSPHLVNVLHRAHIDNLQDLLLAEPEELGRLPGMGQTRLGELRRAVGLHLGGEIDTLPDDSIRNQLMEVHEVELRALEARRDRINCEISQHLHAIGALRLASWLGQTKAENAARRCL